jgi:FlaA1/EpsC-like NDP-sugar epimerase
MTSARLPGPTVRNRYFVLSDMALFTVATALAFALRFEGFEWPEVYRQGSLVYLVVSVPLRLFICYRAGIYKRLWRHASVVEVERLIVAVSAFGIGCVLLGGFILPGLGIIPVRVPISVLFLDVLLSAVFITLPRLGVCVS